MKIVLAQENPPVYEVEGYTGPVDFHEILSWLHSKDLPEDLSLGFEGTLYRFRSRVERVQFALGFDKAFDLLYDEPELPLHRDFEGTAYYQLGTADSKEALEAFARTLLQELYLAKWPEHDGDIKVYVSETCSLFIKRDCWGKLTMRQKQDLSIRCQGFCEALHTVER